MDQRIELPPGWSKQFRARMQEFEEAFWKGLKADPDKARRYICRLAELLWRPIGSGVRRSACGLSGRTVRAHCRESGIVFPRRVLADSASRSQIQATPMKEEPRPPGYKPGDMILNKYMPNATPEEREEARDSSDQHRRCGS